MQANNFGGTFDQLFLWIFYDIFTEDASLLCLYYGAKKSKMTKNSNQGGPALRRDLRANKTPPTTQREKKARKISFKAFRNARNFTV